MVSDHAFQIDEIQLTCVSSPSLCVEMDGTVCLECITTVDCNTPSNFNSNSYGIYASGCQVKGETSFSNKELGLSIDSALAWYGRTSVYQWVEENKCDKKGKGVASTTGTPGDGGCSTYSKDWIESLVSVKEFASGSKCAALNNYQPCINPTVIGAYNWTYGEAVESVKVGAFTIFSESMQQRAARKQPGDTGHIGPGKVKVKANSKADELLQSSAIYKLATVPAPFTVEVPAAPLNSCQWSEKDAAIMCKSNFIGGCKTPPCVGDVKITIFAGTAKTGSFVGLQNSPTIRGDYELSNIVSIAGKESPILLAEGSLSKEKLVSKWRSIDVKVSRGVLAIVFFISLALIQFAVHRLDRFASLRLHGSSTIVASLVCCTVGIQTFIMGCVWLDAYITFKVGAFNLFAFIPLGIAVLACGAYGSLLISSGERRAGKSFEMKNNSLKESPPNQPVAVPVVYPEGVDLQLNSVL
jgi:hypothetical protein